MTMHSAISLLVAVAIPVWLVIEQLLKWKVLTAWGSPVQPRERVEADLASSGSDQMFPAGLNNSTGSALQREAA